MSEDYDRLEKQYNEMNARSEKKIKKPLLSELAAERAKVSRLEAMRDQMIEGCDGHCAIGECVCEKDQRVVDLKDEVSDLQTELAAERAKVKELQEERLERAKMLRDLNRQLDDLIAQNALMREALEKIATTAFQQYDGSKPFVSEHDSGYSSGIADGHRLAAKWAHEAIRALPLPSEVTK